MLEQLRRMITYNLLIFRSIVDVPEEGQYPSGHITKRRNCDKHEANDTWSPELLGLCQATELLIVNGRTPGDMEGEFTCSSYSGQSAVDYFIVSADCMPSVIDMRVLQHTDYCNAFRASAWDRNKSEHYPLQLEIACTITADNAHTNKLASHAKQCLCLKYDVTQAEAHEQCLTAETQANVMPMLFQHGDVDMIASSLIACMTHAADMTMPKVSKGSASNTIKESLV